MSDIFSISKEDILQQLKLSEQLANTIEAIATYKIAARKAQEVGLRVETEELQKAADVFRLKNNLISANETLLWMKKNGFSVDDLEALVYRDVLINKLSEYLFADQVEPYFFDKKLDYTQVLFYEAILDNTDLAMELFYALQEGEITFFEVARQYGSDIETRRRGGYRGLVKRTDLSPELSAAMFKATPPQLLKPIAIGKKTHLVWLEEIIYPVLDKSLRSQILSNLFSEWVKNQLNQMDLSRISY
ncbi:MAG: peptidylprolyl isomerase [Thermosynechococcaceae cyanobacterium]